MHVDDVIWNLGTWDISYNIMSPYYDIIEWYHINMNDIMPDS